MKIFDSIKKPFVTDIFRHFDRPEELKRDDLTIVIRDLREIAHHHIPDLKRWEIIAVRKSMQNFLQER
jgi:hypothetical protein